MNIYIITAFSCVRCLFRISPADHKSPWFFQYNIIICHMNLSGIHSAQIIYADSMSRLWISGDWKRDNANSEDHFSHPLSFNFHHGLNHIACLKYPRISINQMTHVDKQNDRNAGLHILLMILFLKYYSHFRGTRLSSENAGSIWHMLIIIRFRSVPVYIVFMFTKEIHRWTEPTEIMKSKFWNSPVNISPLHSR